MFGPYFDTILEGSVDLKAVKKVCSPEEKAVVETTMPTGNISRGEPLDPELAKIFALNSNIQHGEKGLHSKVVCVAPLPTPSEKTVGGEKEL